MNNHITMKQLVEAQHIVEGTVSTVFAHEKDFIKKVLRNNGWTHEECNIIRCHAANCFRITLQHDDQREKDLYVDNFDVYNWIKGLGIIK